MLERRLTSTGDSRKQVLAKMTDRYGTDVYEDGTEHIKMICTRLRGY